MDGTSPERFCSKSWPRWEKILLGERTTISEKAIVSKGDMLAALSMRGRMDKGHVAHEGGGEI